MKKHLLGAFIAAGLFVTTAATAAVITPVNRDAAGQGLNDPTPVGAVGGNYGTSVGQQRRIVYQFAADLWGAVLQSDVETRVAASFQPLTCSATSGVLGSAGAWWINRDFTGAPVAGIWYHAAVANAIAGENLNAGPDYVAPDDIEISSRFNSNLGTPGCLEASGWYYGLDGKTPSGKINFLDVVMHEIGHGLGFQGFLDKTTGALYDADGAGSAEVPRSDTYTQFAYDNVEDKRFGDPTMTDALRALAMRTPGRLTWDGPAVTAAAPLALSPLLRLDVTGTLTANYEIGTASFGPAATVANFNGDVVLANDGSAAPTQGCVASPAGAYTGKVVIIDRGTCAFEIKTVNAQNAGATEVIIANNAAGVIGMAEDPTVVATIPAVMVSQADGTAIKGALPGVNAAIVVVPGQLSGSDADGRALLYSPTVVATGSTFSHYDVSHSPNALQEPSINSDLDGNFRVDLSPSLYQDIGWSLNTSNAQFGNCNTTIPRLETPGLLAGANLIASHQACAASSGAFRPAYRRCMLFAADRLGAAGLLSALEVAQVKQCAVKP
ncbi:MAG: serine protease [Luteimonas sp.]|nr:serine protease [Luteimonas sp.]